MAPVDPFFPVRLAAQNEVRLFHILCGNRVCCFRFYVNSEDCAQPVYQPGLADAQQAFLLDLCGKDLTGQEPLESANIRIIEDILKI